MKINTFLSLALFSGALLSKAQETQNRNTSAFEKIEISGNVSVYYTQSDSLKLSVKTGAGQINNVETRVDIGTLHIIGRVHFAEPVSVYVQSNQLKELQVSGASSFYTTEGIKTDTLLLSVSSSANVSASVTALTIRSIESGAAQITLSGTTDRLYAELSGASSLKAYKLISKNAGLLTTGASSSKIYVTEKLKASATGASSIKIKGTVTDISAEAGSAASITKIASKNNSVMEEGRDSTTYNWRGRKIIVIGKEKDGDQQKDSIKKTTYGGRKFKHWAGIALGVNGFMAPGGGIGLPAKSKYMELNYGKSFNFQINLIERQFNIVRDYFKIVTGFGFDYHSYELKNKTTLNPDSSFTSGKMDVSGKFTYDKNRLRNTYIQVPLLLEFNTSRNAHKTFHIALGVVGEYLIASRTRQVLEQDNYEIKKIRKDSYNMSPFIAKAHLNLGYKGWTFFGEYNLTPLFQGGKGPQLYPFTVGLRVIPF